MALLFCDGFEQYGASMDFLKAGWLVSFGSNPAVINSSSSNVRTGTKSATLGTVARRIVSEPTTLFTSVAFYTTPSILINNAITLVFGPSLSDSSGNVVVYNTSAGEIVAWRGLRGNTASGGGELGRSSTGVIVAQTMHVIEVKVVIHNSAGAVIVKVDGTEVINVSGVDTVHSTNEAIVRYVGFTGSGGVHMDDVVIWDGTGSILNDFPSSRLRVHTVFPTADTAEADWAKSTGTDGYALIDEDAPDDDTTYIQADNVNDISEFDLADLAGIGDVLGVQTAFRAYGEGLPVKVQPSIVSGASAGAGTERVMVGSYLTYLDVFETDPNTAAAWSLAGLNAAKMRLERTA